ncbi:MAG: hypothetical protein HUJ65_08095 [Oscillospiraceae bacterium]|nr:hypothetical protein [Oscillospiraceae bacterium]
MEHRVQELFDLLYSMISEAWSVPLGNDKCVIEKSKALDLLDDIRSQFPAELADAKRLMDARAEFIASARREADTIKKTAEERARQLVDEQEILKIARARSNELMASAQYSAAELKRAANEYIDNAMRQTEETLANALDEISQSRAKFHSVAALSERHNQSPATNGADVPFDDE